MSKQMERVLIRAMAFVCLMVVLVNFATAVEEVSSAWNMVNYECKETKRNIRATCLKETLLIQGGYVVGVINRTTQLLRDDAFSALLDIRSWCVCVALVVASASTGGFVKLIARAYTKTRDELRQHRTTRTLDSCQATVIQQQQHQNQPPQVIS